MVREPPGGWGRRRPPFLGGVLDGALPERRSQGKRRLGLRLGLGLGLGFSWSRVGARVGVEAEVRVRIEAGG